MTKTQNRHVLKGGKLLDGTVLKRGTSLYPRRGGRNVEFDRFIDDTFVQVKAGKERRVMTRKSLAGNYSILPGFSRRSSW